MFCQFFTLNWNCFRSMFLVPGLCLSDLTVSIKISLISNLVCPMSNVLSIRMFGKKFAWKNRIKVNLSFTIACYVDNATGCSNSWCQYNFPILCKTGFNHPTLEMTNCQMSMRTNLKLTSKSMWWVSPGGGTRSARVISFYQWFKEKMSSFNMLDKLGQVAEESEIF